jgi:hypothetical protein
MKTLGGGAKRHRQDEWLRIGAGGGHGAAEVPDAVEHRDAGIGGSEFGRGPAIDQGKRRKLEVVRVTVYEGHASSEVWH